jgi:hypothetical protein
MSPDGARIAFGASGPLQIAAALAGPPPGPLAVDWAKLADWFGAKTAEAHGPPWEVWEIGPEGGRPTQITHLYTDGPWPAWSPDGQHLVTLQPGGVLLIGEGDPVYLGPALGHGEVVWAK